jgi:ATP-dependent DNA helicase RecG
MSNDKLQTPIQYVKGVGPKLAQLFKKIGVQTVEDALYLLPRSWEDRSQIAPLAKVRPGVNVVVKGQITKCDSQLTRSRFAVLKVLLNDRTATLQLVWFNQPYLQKLFRPGMRLIVSGRAEYSSYDHILQILVKDYEIDTGDNQQIVPHYHLTEGLYPKKVRSVIKTVTDNYLKYLDDPQSRQALMTIHYPATLAALDPARDYLAYQELYLFQIGLLLHRQLFKQELRANPLTVDQARLAQFKQRLPF